MKQVKSITVRLSDEDLEAIEKVKSAYGLTTISSALRLAARKIAKNVERRERKHGKEND